MISDPERRKKILSLLLQHGADILATDEHEDNPLHSASYFGRLEAVEVLIPYYSTKGALNAGGLGNETALHKAAWSKEIGRYMSM